ncbi:hypothetical protein Dsin_028371 [Dipteronia sinensis]|uniref:FAS1 domain-containing protein n=1 Tax=Dipteronia sinensis TaxID=43782 RepID=A0AAD9ZR66_9ROSI|nr:hypothetical protein Dsin_028371 [Dipteronia sinensis]
MSLIAKSLLLLLFTTTIMSASSPPPPPPPQQQQLNNIIDALIGAGDFNSWANMLSSADPTAFPLWATFFIPSDSSEESSPAVDRMAMVMAYHVVPQRLSFSELCLLKPLTRLPTLLPTKSILITNNSISNFTLDEFSSFTSAPLHYFHLRRSRHPNFPRLLRLRWCRQPPFYSASAPYPANTTTAAASTVHNRVGIGCCLLVLVLGA